MTKILFFISLHRGNVPAENISDYYKRVITIPFIDHLNSQVKLRFDESALNAFYGLSVIPAKMTSLIYRPGKYTWQQKFEFFAEQYRDDLHNYFALDAELTTWEDYWESFEGDQPDNISKTLNAISFVGFENIKVALIILATLLVTSCECERSFSAMRRLKNYNRSTMAEDPRRAKSGVKMCHLILVEIRPVAYLQEISLWNKF